jgi:hypothetical protein
MALQGLRGRMVEITRTVDIPGKHREQRHEMSELSPEFGSLRNVTGNTAAIAATRAFTPPQ